MRTHAWFVLLTLPSLAAGQSADPWRPRTTPLWGVRYAPDLGAVFGLGVLHERFAFRALPASTRLALRAAYATRTRMGEGDLSAELRRPLAPATLTVDLHASGLDLVKFYGLGNETAATPPDSLYRLRQTQVVAAATVATTLLPRLRLSVGPVLKHTRTRAGGNAVFATTGPYYGGGSFGVIGGTLSLDFDTRDSPTAAARGTRLRVTASGFPAAWDATAAFGTISVEGSSYWSAGDPAPITLALRAEGAASLGRVPFQELIYVGGETTVRGYAEQRFAGRRGAYTNAELRLRAVRIGWGDIGVFGLADAGRVWVTGETSDRWHAAAGGGVWLAPGGRRADTITLAVARSPERTSFYLRVGFLF